MHHVHFFSLCYPYYGCKHLGENQPVVVDVIWELVKHSEKCVNMEGGASDWGKLCARREAQCRPMLEQSCNQSEPRNCVKPFVNCSKNSVSTHKHLGHKSYTLWRLFCIFSFLIRSMEMHPKPEFSSYFLCTVNIQSIDRGIYIQFGTLGLDQQKKVYHI